MKVRALQEGFLLYYRQIGDEFEINPKQFSKKWMEEVEEEDEKPSKNSKGFKAQPSKAKTQLEDDVI